MNNPKKRVTAIVSLILTVAILLSLFAVSLPAFSAVEKNAEELVEVGAAHRSASYNGLPSANVDNLNRSISGIFLDSKVQYLNIYGKHQLSVMDCYSNTINTRVRFSSSSAKIATVSDSGLIKANSNGMAKITATDTVNGNSCVCTVYVGNEYAPTEAPSPSPTDEPTEKPVSTQVPTQKPTQTPTSAPTAKPTQAPTQKPTQVPTQAPTQKPTSSPVNETLSLKASSATVYRGNYYHVVAVSNVAVSFSSSNTSVATVNYNGIVTALKTGTVTITAKTSTKSATCKLTIVSGNSVNISHTTATVDRFMTFLMSSSTSGVKWESSDTSVATVDRGFVYGVKAGTAVIKAYTSSGAATCLMTVAPSNVVRFAYASPNCAAKNQSVTLVCITDTMRTGVRFEVNVGGTTKYVNATSKTKDADTYIWKGTTTFSSSGTYKVKAYSQFNNGTDWYTCKDGETTAFVTNSTNMSTSVCAERRASDDVINLIATFEGFSKSAYDDILTGGNPTLGYGRVVRTGEEFYNELTKAEAYAYLVQTVNNEGYADNVNYFLTKNNVKYNQQQFDALVCFVYNCGSGPLYTDADLISALLDCSDGSGSQKTYYINGDYVRIRKGPGTNYDIIKELNYGTTLTILSTSNSAWYQVQLSDGTKGYVSSDYISSRSTGGNLDLKYINKQSFIEKLCAYHHANGCVWGLLFRRVDETEMFFYGDYEPNYGNYKYPIKYTCKKNPAYHT